MCPPCVRYAIDTAHSEKVPPRVGLVVLGESFVALPCGAAKVTGWQRPHFIVVTGDGRRVLLRASSVAAKLLFGPDSFFDPRLFTFDWTTFRPYLNPGWRRGLFAYAARFQASVPRAWLDPVEHDQGITSSQPPPGASADEFRVHRQAFLRSVLSQLSDNARAASTVEGLKNAGLKLLWFLATMNAPLPPSQGHYVDYLAFLTTNAVHSDASRKHPELSGTSVVSTTGTSAPFPLVLP